MKLTGNLVDIEITDHRDGFINVKPRSLWIVFQNMKSVIW